MVILVPVAVLDLLVGLRLARVKITRQLPNNLTLGSWIKVNLEIRHRFIRPAFIQIFDHYLLDTKTNLLPLTVKLTPGNISKIYYRLQPVKRMETPIFNFDQALSYLATSDFLQKRTESMKALALKGVITLDVTARELPVTIVNTYHKLKRSGRL